MDCQVQAFAKARFCASLSILKRFEIIDNNRNNYKEMNKEKEIIIIIIIIKKILKSLGY